jgi:hypothetical protein
VNINGLLATVSRALKKLTTHTIFVLPDMAVEAFLAKLVLAVIEFIRRGHEVKAYITIAVLLLYSHGLDEIFD